MDHGFSVELLTAYFPPDTPDSDWLELPGKKNWVVLTKDTQIQNNQIEIAALRRWNVAAFALRSAEMTGPEMADSFCGCLPQLVKIVNGHDRPFVCTVSPSGAISMLYTASGLLAKYHDNNKTIENKAAAKRKR